MPFPTNISKEHLLKAIEKIDREGIPKDAGSAYYDVIFNGKRYPPKVVVSFANIFANSVELDRNTFSGGLNTPCFKLLEKNGFVIETKNAPMSNPKVKIYEIKSGASVNAPGLLSPDGKYFYWDDDKFQGNQVGDEIFFVNPTHRWALCTRIGVLSIPSTHNAARRESTFNHEYNTYHAEDTQGKYKIFIRFDIIKRVPLPTDWKWTKMLGQSEVYDLWKGGEPMTNVEDRLQKIDDLKVLFVDGDAYEILEENRGNLLNGTTIIGANKQSTRNVWFVCQGKTFTPDAGRKYLWAPIKDRNNVGKYYWENMAKVNTGDIIFNYADGIQGVSIATSDGYLQDNTNAFSEWGKEGRKVDIDLTELNKIIKYGQLKARKDDFVAVLDKGQGPFDTNGDVKQGYLFKFSKTAGRIVRDIYGQPFGKKEIDDFFDDAEVVAYTKKKNEMTPKEIIAHVHRYMMSKGFQYQLEEIANFYLALKAKPFVILAGISGTGKSQLPKQFAKAIGMEKEQIILVPVRPDWTDGSDLLGYTGLDNKFKPKDLTIAIIEAQTNPEKPFFFILDEMNLARVEHYFSDFLSVIETREWLNNERSDIITDPMLRKEVLQTADNTKDFKDLMWPKNLYLVGTVNMDETTHAFSRKVLDRANSIEMNEVDLDWAETSDEEFNALRGITNSFFETEFIGSIDLTEGEKDDISVEMELLKKVNSILQKADLHFAYRVRDEVAFYLLLNKKYGLMESTVALDFQLVQKVLPRIHGSSERIQTVLIELLNLLEGSTVSISNFQLSDLVKMEKADLKYKRSSRKILFMLKRFDDDRFTSFWL